MIQTIINYVANPHDCPPPLLACKSGHGAIAINEIRQGEGQGQAIGRGGDVEQDRGRMVNGWAGGPASQPESFFMDHRD